MAERRKDYRIQGRAQILIKLLERAQITKESVNECARGHFMNEDLMAFATAYELLCNRSIEAMTRLRNSDSELSDVLSILDQKLDLIEQRFHFSGLDEKVEPKDICLSASGASFLQETPYEEGCRMALRLTLLPGHSLIYTFARCIRCDHTDAGEYEIAVNFVNLGAQESKLLRRHIMQVERELLRREAKVIPISD